jgi:hypothetical protein
MGLSVAKLVVPCRNPDVPLNQRNTFKTRIYFGRPRPEPKKRRRAERFR